MKKFISLLLICLLALPALTVFPSAADREDLPFPLTPPEYVAATWLEGGDSPTTVNLSYSLSNPITSFFKKLENAVLENKTEELLSPYGVSEIWITTQVDWAVDDVNDAVSGWHYNEFWDADSYFGLGKDKDGLCRVGEWDGVDMGVGNATETVNTHWVTRGVSLDALNGDPAAKRPGLKDQMRPDQYTYQDDALRIDYEKHTVFYRMRLIAITRGDKGDSYYYSEWSNTASVGKGAEQATVLTAEDLPAPVITGLRMTEKEFNDNPVVAFTLEVPDAFREKVSKTTSSGGYVRVEVEARVKGDPGFTPLQGDWIVKGGEMEASLFSLATEERPNVPKDSIVELRCRYSYDHPSFFDGTLYSGYSKVISFGTDDINAGKTPVSEGENEDETSSCPLCHFCPQPLGLCIFIWLLILIVLIVVIVIVIAAVKKKNKNKNR